MTTRGPRGNAKTVTIGDTFGRWTVTGPFTRQGKYNEAVFPCTCDCGTVSERTFKRLREAEQGRNISCGCVQKEAMASKRKYGYEPNSHQWNRERWLRHAYGITVEDFDRMIVKQCGLCDICGDQLVDPHVDHCHASMEVRGLLCKSCNLLLGYARDRIDILENAVMYLQQ